MLKNLPLKKEFGAISFLFILLSCSLFVLIDSLLSSMLSETQIKLIRSQLIIGILSLNAFFALLYFFYNNWLKKIQAASINQKLLNQNPLGKESPSENKTTQNQKHYTTSYQSLRLLAVDDNKSNLLMIKNYLDTYNIPILLAKSGTEALLIAQEKPLNMIFMDIEMSDLDGIQTVQNMRSSEPNRTPIIATSAHSKQERQLDILSLGFDDYIEKPITEEALLNSIKRWCCDENIVIPTHTIPSKTPTAPNASSSTASALTSPVNTTAALTNLTTIDNTSDNETPVNKVVDIKKSLTHSNHNAKLAKDMLDLLIQMLSDEKENLYLFHETHDWDSLYKLNHKIYGGSSYCEVPALQKANQQLEKLLQRKLHSDDPSEQDDPYSLEIDANNFEIKINQRLGTLYNAIDDILQWNEEYDTAIVFEVDE